MPISNETAFLQGIAVVKETLKSKSDRFFLYATWERKEDNDWLTNVNMTSQEITLRRVQAYDTASTRFDMPVIHAGKAFGHYQITHSNDELYDTELPYPSVLGSRRS